MVRVAALVHFYVPFRNAGSETMLHTMLRSLTDAGHEVAAFVTDTPEAPYVYTYEGVRVTSANRIIIPQVIGEFKPDVIVTHHDNAVWGINLAAKWRIPSVFLMHNDYSGNRDILRLHPDLVVFNTNWIREAAGYSGASIVVHPPVLADEHATDPGDRVTLVNLNADKGAWIFYRLAELLPDVEFLGVVGGHGRQIRMPRPNLEIVEHTSRMVDDVWSRTRVLLMPSRYESYGMAGVEAMASGIPVVAAPTPGLLESLSYAGTFVAREDEDGWVHHIRRLHDPQKWADASALALKRSAELDPSAELGQWVSQIEGLIRARSHG